MNGKTSAVTGNKALVLFAMSMTSLAVTELMLRNGIETGTDGWFYWEGSVNIIEHHGYFSMAGERIIWWPPFFAMFLALFQMIFSQTVSTLDWAMGLISALSAATWGSYVYKVFPEQEGPLKSIAGLGSLVFVTLFASLTCAVLLSNPFVLVFLGILFGWIATLPDRKKFWRYYQGPLILGVTLCGAILTHNSCLIFVLVTVFAVTFAAGATWRQRSLGAAFILLLGLVPWLFVRHWLVQEGSHSISKPIYTFTQYIAQAFYGMGVLVVPLNSLWIQAAVGFVLIGATIIVACRIPRTELEQAQRLCLIFSLLSLAGFFVLWNLVWIDYKLGGRFFWYFPLSVMPILLCRARKQLPLVVLLLLLTVGVTGWRVSKLVYTAAVPPLASGVKEEYFTSMHSEYFLTTRADAPTPVGTVRIQVPVFRWEKIPPEAKLETTVLLR